MNLFRVTTSIKSKTFLIIQTFSYRNSFEITTIQAKLKKLGCFRSKVVTDFSCLHLRGSTDRLLKDIQYLSYRFETWHIDSEYKKEIKFVRAQNVP